MPGARLEYWNRSSAAIAGPTISPSVSAGPSPSWVNRSPHMRVPRRLLVQHARVPAMRGMRRIDVAHALAAAEVDGLSVVEHARRAVRHVVQRHHAAGAAVRELEPAGATASHSFMAPHSSASKWPKAIQRRRSGGMSRLTAARVSGNIFLQAGVKQQRLIAESKELVEREAGRRGDVRHECRQAIDAVADLTDPGLHVTLHGQGVTFRRAGRHGDGLSNNLIVHMCVVKIAKPVNMTAHMRAMKLI